MRKKTTAFDVILYVVFALLTLIMTPLTYFVVLDMIRKYRAMREKKLARKAQAGIS